MKTSNNTGVRGDGLKAHIVPIKRAGVVIAHQLRLNGGGPGNTTYFSAGKHGDESAARRAAIRAARKLGVKTFNRRGGSPVGRVTKLSKTGTAGIRFEWSDGPTEVVLLVRATWTSKRGRACSTCYSTAANGLESALDRAIKKRTSCGAPKPDKHRLLTLLRKTYRHGPT
jgi:hypothetical protein